MKIEYVKGDLFSTDIKHIAHGCNSKSVMGSGVAKIVKDQFPEAYNEYMIRDLRLGEIIVVESGGKVIINAVTQKNYGRDGSRYVSYDAVASCMEAINEHFMTMPNGRVAMPQIGAGLGGGDWKVIEAIIESELTCVHPVVYML